MDAVERGPARPAGRRRPDRHLRPRPPAPRGPRRRPRPAGERGAVRRPPGGERRAGRHRPQVPRARAPRPLRGRGRRWPRTSAATSTTCRSTASATGARASAGGSGGAATPAPLAWGVVGLGVVAGGRGRARRGGRRLSPASRPARRRPRGRPEEPRGRPIRRGDPLAGARPGAAGAYPALGRPEGATCGRSSASPSGAAWPTSCTSSPTSSGSATASTCRRRPRPGRSSGLPDRLGAARPAPGRRRRLDAASERRSRPTCSNSPPSGPTSASASRARGAGRGAPRGPPRSSTRPRPRSARASPSTSAASSSLGRPPRRGAAAAPRIGLGALRPGPLPAPRRAGSSRPPRSSAARSTCGRRTSGRTSTRASAASASARFDDAVAAFRTCIALAPEAAICHYNRALAYDALGRTDDVPRGYTQAIELDPDLAAAWLNRGILSYKPSDRRGRRRLRARPERPARPATLRPPPLQPGPRRARRGAAAAGPRNAEKAVDLGCEEARPLRDELR